MNVICIMLDSLRTDHVGVYGKAHTGGKGADDWPGGAGPGGRARTPAMDRFAHHSLVFDRAYAGSFPTLPCRRDLFTGRWGHPFNTWDEMERDLPTLAETFRRAGHSTGLIFDTPIFMTQGNFLDRGFGSIEWIRGQGGEPWIADASLDIKLPAAEHKVKSGLHRYLLNQSRRRYECDYLGPRVFREAMHWLEKNYQSDFFLWIDSWDPHEPWDPPQYYVDLYDRGWTGDEIQYPCYGFSLDFMSEAELNHTRALYAAEVTMTDRWVGYFLDTVELLGLYDNTIVVLMSDHGHYFGDHGLQGKPWGDLGQLYEPMVRQVLMLRKPDGPVGARSQALVQPIDLFPTLCELAGLPASTDLNGRSFAPVIGNPDVAHREVAISGRNLDDNWGTVPAMVTDGRWSLQYWPNKDLAYKGRKPVRQETYPNTGMPERRVDELFDLDADPDQEINLLAQHPEGAVRLHAALRNLIALANTDPKIARTYDASPS
ncbi:MAG: sulfatase [Candidatus Latescibacterota bacterium]|nr:sulfatase [Candidatus Latescibacterota bacterium]